jgi:hypothetical protein
MVGERTCPKGLVWLLTLITIVCLIVVIICIVPCPRRNPDPNLIIKHETVATWITLENSFLTEQDACRRPFWNGILFQLGMYKGATRLFSVAELERTTGEITSYDSGSFTWINIVAQKDIGSETECPEPMAPQSAFLLFPKDDPVDGREKIHDDFLPVAIITYWQGGQGWKLESNVLPMTPPYDEHRFWFRDPFRVEVYKAVQAEGQWRMELVRRYEDVRQIRLLSQTTPELGTKQDPPWRYP